MPGRFELPAQFAKVVDLSVEDDPDRAILVMNRLVAGRQVDDAEASHAERHTLVHQQPLIVWAAMTNRLTHTMDQLTPLVLTEGADGAEGAEAVGLRRFGESGNSTHDRQFL